MNPRTALFVLCSWSLLTMESPAQTSWNVQVGDWTTPANWTNGTPTAADVAFIRNCGAAALGSGDLGVASNLSIATNPAPGTSSLLITGANTSLTVSFNTFVGFGDPDATGILNVTSGGAFSTKELFVGQAGSTGRVGISSGGTITVDGGTGLVVIGTGENGVGTLNIGEEGGGVAAEVLNAGEVRLGGTGENGTQGRLNFYQLDDITFSPIISGSEKSFVWQSGPGKTTLVGANTYQGNTYVGSGILNIQNSSALGTADTGTQVLSGGSLELQGEINVVDELLFLSGFGGAKYFL